MKPNNPRELTEAMQTLLKDPDLAKRMGKNAKLRAKKFFMSNKLARSYLQIYSQVLRITKSSKRDEF